MTAACLASHGGADVEEPPPVDIVPAEPRAVSIDALRESLSRGEEEAAEPGAAGGP
jgi:hypothetical protein